jgi:hypothetical protein
MLDDLRGFLNRSGMLGGGRPTEEERWKLAAPGRDGAPENPRIFREEQLELRTVALVPRPSDPFLKDGLTLWIAENKGAGHSEPDVLVLIERFPLADEPFAAWYSGHSLLASWWFSRGDLL